MTCPWCQKEDGEHDAGARRCQHCQHWYIVPFKEDAPTLATCAQCGYKFNQIHMVGEKCIVCATPSP